MSSTDSSSHPVFGGKGPITHPATSGKRMKMADGTATRPNQGGKSAYVSPPPPSQSDDNNPSSSTTKKKGGKSGNSKKKQNSNIKDNEDHPHQNQNENGDVVDNGGGKTNNNKKTSAAASSSSKKHGNGQHSASDATDKQEKQAAQGFLLGVVETQVNGLRELGELVVSMRAGDAEEFLRKVTENVLMPVREMYNAVIKKRLKIKTGGESNNKLLTIPTLIHVPGTSNPPQFVERVFHCSFKRYTGSFVYVQILQQRDEKSGNFAPIVNRETGKQEVVPVPIQYFWYTKGTDVETLKKLGVLFTRYLEKQPPVKKPPPRQNASSSSSGSRKRSRDVREQEEEEEGDEEEEEEEEENAETGSTLQQPQPA